MGSSNCYCNLYRFNTINELIEFLNKEEEALAEKMKDIAKVQVEVDLTHKKETMENNLAMQNINSVLAELSYFLSRLDKKYTKKKSNEIFSIVQNELLYYYFTIKNQNYPIIVSNYKNLMYVDV
jgi:hypothetical protein